MEDSGRMSVQRWRSLEDLLNFSELENTVSQLEKVCEEPRWRKGMVPLVAGAAAVGAGALALCLAPFTGGLSLAAAGGAPLGAGGTAVSSAVFTGGLSLVVAGAAGAVTAARTLVVQHRITDKDTLEEVQRLTEQLCDLLRPLKDAQLEMRWTLETVDTEAADAVVRLRSLTEGLSALVNNFDSDSAVERLLEVTEQSRNILKELEELRRNIRKRPQS